MSGEHTNGASDAGRASLGPGLVEQYLKVLLGSMEQSAKIGQNPTSRVLFGMAIFVVVIALLFKFRPIGLQIGALEPVEFVALLLFAVALLAAGTTLRIYGVRLQTEVADSQAALTAQVAREEAALAARQLERAAELHDNQRDRTSKTQDDRDKATDHAFGP